MTIPDAWAIASRFRRPAVVAAVSSAGLLAGCAAPFSDLQSARLAGPSQVEVTPGYSAVAFSADGESQRAHDHFGVQVATGINDRMDVRARYERITLSDELSDEGGDGVHVLAVGPKFGLRPDRVALFVPVGFAFGSDIDSSDTFQIHPTLLLSLPVHEHVELNGSLKALIPITDRDVDDLVAFNIGLGLGPDLSRWAVRPEIGFMFNPGEEGRFRHLSIGLTYYFERP